MRLIRTRLATAGTLVVLVLDAALLAAVELLFLPLRVAGVPLPVTILLAAVSTPWLVRSAAALDGSPALAAAPLVTWVSAVLVFGIAGPGGDVLLPADWWRSLVLLAAGIFPGAVALGRVLARGVMSPPPGRRR
ncbi:MAG TPA: hypothetical protein VFQ77_22225 [Pseudonocardiaceae bacterium]|nr:hypothetical protein [Pseudonocardiaceae bacterium]